MRIAYVPIPSNTFYNSAKEGTGQGWPYCHNEPLWTGALPAPVGYKEQLTGITGLPSGYGTTLTFVNPWTNFQILDEGSNQMFFIYVKALNPYAKPITVKGGTLLAHGASWKPGQAESVMIAQLFGTYYQNAQGVWTYVRAGTSWGSNSIPPTTGTTPTWFYLIFLLYTINDSKLDHSLICSWIGSAAVSDLKFDSSYFGGEFLLDGLTTVPNQVDGVNACPT
jgi:hypothetical protein